jgi:hypothetical protein
MNANTPATPPPPNADESFAEAHREMLGDGAIQFDLPDPRPPQPEIDFISLGPLLEIAFWLAVAGIVAFLLYLIVPRLIGARWAIRFRGEKEERAGDAWRPEAAEARELLGEADALAAAGRYSEAAHLILFRSIEDIDEKRPDLVRPALTSRDIAALEAIPGGPRSAFARIAMMVERSLFAQRPLGASDWNDCRAAYQQFAFAEGWRG